jgi:hypothetical protein
LIDSFIPTVDAAFDILTAGSVLGVFADDGLPLAGQNLCLFGNYLSDRFQILARASAEIIRQPHSRLACVGDSVRFSVGAVGTNVTYQWRWNTQVIDSATDSTFAIASAGYGDGGNYDVLIGADCGADTSDIAVLSVLDCTGLTGACCLPDLSCQVLSATECYAAGGFYGGDNFDCDQIPCGNPAGVENPADPSEAAAIPTELSFRGLSQADGSAAFELGLPYPAEVKLTLFDIAGRSVARLQNGMLPAGMHGYPITSALGGRLASGIYFGRAEIQSKEFKGARTGRIRLVR